MAADALIKAHDQMVRGVQGQIMALVTDNDLGTQLLVLRRRCVSWRFRGAAAGIPLEQVAAARQAAAQQLIKAANELERQRAQQARGAYEQIAAARGDTSLGTQLHILETQMGDLAHAAAEVGIPLSEVTKAHQMAAAALIRQRDQQMRVGLRADSQARGDTSLGTQLHVLDTQMRELAKAATDLGIPLSEVTKAHQMAAKELVRQNEQNVRGVYSQLASVRGDQSLGSNCISDTQMRELAHTADQLGIPMKVVAQTWQAAADALVRQNTANIRNFYSQLGDIAGDQGLRMALLSLETQFTDLYQSAGELGSRFSMLPAFTRRRSAS